MATLSLRTSLVTLFLLTLLAPMAQASDSHGHDDAAAVSAKAREKARVKKLAKLGVAERLYEEYRHFDMQAELNKACLLDSHCKKPEDGMLEASQEASKILTTLEKRARDGDNESAYYLGIVMYDQARLFAARASGMREDPSMRPTHDMLMRRAQGVFQQSGAFLAQAARGGEPEACMRYGGILADGLGGQIDRKLGYKLFRCAALGFIDREQRGRATDAYLRMLEMSDPRDIATAQVYAKLRPEEPKSPWRKPPKHAE